MEQIIREVEQDPKRTFAFIQFEPEEKMYSMKDFSVITCRRSCDYIFQALYNRNYELIPDQNKTIYPEIPSRYSKIGDEHYLFSVKKCKFGEQCNLYQGPIGE